MLTPVPDCNPNCSCNSNPSSTPNPTVPLGSSPNGSTMLAELPALWMSWANSDITSCVAQQSRGRHSWVKDRVCDCASFHCDFNDITVQTLRDIQIYRGRYQNSLKTLDKVRGLGFDFISSIVQWYCLSGDSYCSGECYSGFLHLYWCKYEWLWDEAASEVTTVLSLGLKPNPLSQTVTLTLAVTLILSPNLNQWAFLSSD